ncbi:uncharacterized protein BCR38DRAFT_486588 [Pseudomassariella vexata]|uniref:DUF7704 domain-containing protein n=1 Tax=Pseudomassariella vexata TaxID=1141098 RepID=A0A1Y2DUK2_9PEZI|nr:uncharacterized protein BCR38DRAFT_486588 [Pseudomassariella vexata]ORY62325.1 hypothetical protein BCR38DRAFT_486588 [Pseudomassariella vexata]
MAPTTASLLPTLPRVFFLYLEPIFISYGMFMNFSQSTHLFKFLDTTNISPNLPILPLPTLILPAQSASYLLNMMLYGLIILLATPPSKKLLQAHIAILIIADLTHWVGLFHAIAQTDPNRRGWAAVLDTEGWTPEVWNLALYPVGTLAVKGATLMGWFGEIAE